VMLATYATVTLQAAKAVGTPDKQSPNGTCRDPVQTVLARRDGVSAARLEE
jgi:hypothetical protein